MSLARTTITGNVATRDDGGGAVGQGFAQRGDDSPAATAWRGSVRPPGTALPDFRLANQDGEAVIEFYQDPTLTIGPGIIRAIMHRFMDGMAGVKIAVNVFQEEAETSDYALTGLVVQEYLDRSLVLREDPEEDLLDVRNPSSEQPSQADENQNMLRNSLSPIMGGMMIFYAFFTGASEFQQKVTFQRALEGEIARTIGSVDGVTSPQVQLVLPEDDLFADEATPATAAVMLGNSRRAE